MDGKSLIYSLLEVLSPLLNAWNEMESNWRCEGKRWLQIHTKHFRASRNVPCFGLLSTSHLYPKCTVNTLEISHHRGKNVKLKPCQSYNRHIWFQWVAKPRANSGNRCTSPGWHPLADTYFHCFCVCVKRPRGKMNKIADLLWDKQYILLNSTTGLGLCKYNVIFHRLMHILTRTHACTDTRMQRTHRSISRQCVVCY